MVLWILPTSAIATPLQASNASRIPLRSAAQDAAALRFQTATAEPPSFFSFPPTKRNILRWSRDFLPEKTQTNVLLTFPASGKMVSDASLSEIMTESREDDIVWQFRIVSHDSDISIFAAADIDGVPYIVGASTSEENIDNCSNVLAEIMAHCGRCKPAAFAALKKSKNASFHWKM